MGNKNRRLYKRIMALLLVVLLILPNVISSVGTKAEGEGVIEGISNITLSSISDGNTASVTIEKAEESDVDMTSLTASVYLVAGSGDVCISNSVNPSVDETSVSVQLSISVPSGTKVHNNDQIYAVISDGSTNQKSTMQTAGQDINLDPATLLDTAPVIDENGNVTVSLSNNDSVSSISGISYTVYDTGNNSIAGPTSVNVSVEGETGTFTIDNSNLGSYDYYVVVSQQDGVDTSSSNVIKNNYVISISSREGIQEILLNNATVSGDSFVVNKNIENTIVVKAAADKPYIETAELTVSGLKATLADDTSECYKIATFSNLWITADDTLNVVTKEAVVSEVSIEATNTKDTFYPGYIYGYSYSVKMDPANAPHYEETVSSNNNDITINGDNTFSIDRNASKGSFKLIVNVNGEDTESSVYSISTESMHVKYYNDDSTRKSLYNDKYAKKGTNGAFIEGRVNKDNYSDFYIGKKDDSNHYWQKLSDSATVSGDEYIFTDGVRHNESFYVKARAYKDKSQNNDGNSNNMLEVEKEILIDGESPTFDLKVESYASGKTEPLDDDTSGVERRVINVLNPQDPEVKDANNESANGSGINSVKYVEADDTYTADYKPSIDDEKLKPVNDNIIPFDKDNLKKTTDFIVYVFDNVGNVSGKKITVEKIESLTLDDASVEGKKPDDGTYYLKKGELVSFTEKGMILNDEASNEKEGSEKYDGSFYFQLIKINGDPVTIDEGDNTFSDYSVKQSTEKSEKAETSDTRRFSFEFLKEGTYEIEITVWDPSLSEKEVKTTKVVYDTTNPVISFDKRIQNQTDKQIINTGEDKLQVVKEVKDNLSGLDKFTCKVSSAYKADGTKFDLSSLINNFEKNKSYNDVVKEGIYKITYEVTDKSGNKTTETREFIFDVTKPDSLGNVEISANNKRDYSDYQFFDKDSIVISLDVEDKESGIESVSVIQNNVTIPSSFGTTEPGNGESKKSVEFTIPTNYKGYLNIELVDVAGNKNTVRLNTKDFAGVIKDDGTAQNNLAIEATKVDSKYDKNTKKQYYNKNDSPKISYDAQDDISGLFEITLYGDGDTKKEQISDKKTGYDKKDEPVILKDSGSWDFSTYTQKNEEKEYSLKAYMEDNAGNYIGSNIVETVVDNIAPEISVTFNGASTAADTYNNDVSVVVSVKETYFSDAEVVVYDGNSVVDTPKTKEDFVVSNGISTCTFTLSKDSVDQYWISVKASDKAANESTYDTSNNRFILDKTSPRLNLTFNNNDVRNGKYYKAERIGTLTVEEHNFDANSVHVNVSVKDSAPGVGVPSNSGFSTSGDTHTSSIPFKQDATYEITVTAQDKAGNSADRTITESFVVDLTAPEIKISNVEQNKLYSGTVRPDIEVTDRNYEAKGTKITLESSRDGGAAAKSLAESYSTTSVANGERFTYTNFKKEEDKDDYYSVKAVAEDLAGNTSEETVGFMVDRFGSYYTLNGYTEGLVKAVYTNLEGDDEIVIEAHNLADIDESTVYFTVGEDTKTLKENEGYTVSEDKGSDHWNVSTYTFDKSLFDAEGEYNIVVSTKDSEGNVADNETKDAPVKFVIDRTAPEFVISGIEDGHDYEDQKSVSGNIEIHDNIGVSKAVITLDGEAQTYEAKDLEAMNNTVPVEFTKGAHSIEVKVVDLAGNESADDKGISFTVDQSAIERAAWWIFIVIGVIVVGGIVFFVVRRRNNA